MILRQDRHCETGLKQTRELFSWILSTISAPNQLLSWKPFIRPDLPRLYWQGAGEQRLGGEEEQMSSHAFARLEAYSQNGHVCEVWCPNVIIKL